MKKNHLALILLCSLYAFHIHSAKIVGLIAVKNEQNCIEQCLHALSLYTDAIVVLDDVSEDLTPQILLTCKNRYHVHIISKKNVWQRDEAKDRNILLNYGRAIGGTHFIVIDADEIFTAPCNQDNFLRKKILALSPGDWLSCKWINLHLSLNEYRADNLIKPFIFCDEPNTHYDDSVRIHAKRIPEHLSRQEYFLTPTSRYGLLHFKYINWDNVLLRNAWYQCLIVTMWPNIPRHVIGSYYAQKLDEQTCTTQKSNPTWFNYPFFDVTDFAKPDHWRAQQITHWITQYGAEYFKDLSIWNTIQNICGQS